MSGYVSNRRAWIFAAVAGAALIAGGAAVRLRARRSGDPDAPSDVGFMFALHDALRRDLSRLREAAASIEGSAQVPATVLAGWDTFRDELDFHHHAEDEDLWPVLRRELSDPRDLAAVDVMVEEHQHIEPALAAADSALHGTGDLMTSVEDLSAVLLDHLAHEEREVLPLIEQHMTRAQWRAFLVTERNRRRPRERPEFLGWVLDDAGEQDAAAVLAEVPPPARLAYRWVIRPRHDAQHLWQLPAPAATA
ncbi:MAG TPA: hemerythrin domain-containing protein [Streptosporangiaceae bacterium]